MNIKFVIGTVMSLSFGFSEMQAQHQGVQGEVFWLSGNQLPAPGQTIAPQQGIVREIYFYAPTYAKDTEQADGFFTSIKTAFVAKTTSAADGSFHIKLPPGEYSVFVKEQRGFFANLFDRNGKINPVVVKPKRYSWITVTIDYQASY